MVRIEKLVLVVLVLLAGAVVVDFILDYELFWSQSKSFDQTDIHVHLLILSLVTASLVLFWRMCVYRQRSERDIGRTSEVLGQNQARFDAIVAALGAGVSIQDLDFKVIYQNDEHRRLADRDAVGCYCYQAYSRQEQVCEGCPVDKSFKDGGVHRLVKELPPGRPASHIEIMASALKDSQGTIVAGIELVRDISAQESKTREIAMLNEELQCQKGQLQDVNSELEAFSYSLAHDLRSQLTPMILGAEALVNSYRSQLDDNGRLFVDAIIQSSEKIEAIVDGMLVLGKLRDQDMECASFDISSMVMEIADGLRLAAPERVVSWEVTPSLLAWGDARLVRIALQNLIENAWKYTSGNEAARICFGLSQSKGVSRFFVRDDGVGFDPADADGLFQPFRRLHGSEFEGSGIGLATVQRIIQRHGGSIEAEATPGEGATFYFDLPEEQVV